ncbi:DHA2 family efflux MFS transporter permease subunit [Mycobacterium europaeum]
MEMPIDRKPARMESATSPGFPSPQLSSKQCSDPDKLDASILRITAVCVLSMMMPLCDVTVVIVAQRTWITAFDTTPAVVAWTMTGYTLALAAVIPLAGWAADRFGTKRLFMGSVVAFTLGSLLCAIAPNIALLIAFRLVQGLGSGMLIPLVTIILTREAGAKRLGRILSVLGVPTLLAPLFGLVLGGWLIDTNGWPSIFWINLPIGLIACILAAIVFPNDHPAPSETFDFKGMMLLLPGLAAFLYGVSLIPSCGSLAKPRVWIPVIIGLVLITAFAFHALGRTQHPLIDLRLFTNRVVVLANAATLLFYPSCVGVLVLLPSYFQEVLHETPSQAGMSMAPRALGAMLTMALAGALIDKRGPGKVLLLGNALLAAGLAIFAYGVAERADYLPTLLGGLTIMGLGAGCAIPSLSASAMYALTPHQIARGSTLFNVNQHVAASLGTVLMSVILTSQFNRTSMFANEKIASLQHEAARHGASIDTAAVRQRSLHPDFPVNPLHALAHAYTVALGVAVVLMVLAILPSVFLPYRPSASARNAGSDERQTANFGREVSPRR